MNTNLSLTMINHSSSVEIWNHQWNEFRKTIHYRINSGIIQEILKLFPDNIQSKKIIELGAGSGGDIICLTKLGALGTALDFSPQSIKVCQHLAKTQNVKLKTILADCQNTKLPNSEYDLVFSVGLVEHFINPLSIIKEQLRILKKGGYLIIDVPQKFNLYTLVKKIRMKNGTFPFGWETEYSLFDLKNISHHFNLKIIKFYGRDSAFTLRIPGKLRPIYQNLFSLIEKSFLAPLICLNIGLVVQKL